MRMRHEAINWCICDGTPGPITSITLAFPWLASRTLDWRVLIKTSFIVAIKKVSTLSALYQHHENLSFARCLLADIPASGCPCSGAALARGLRAGPMPTAATSHPRLRQAIALQAALHQGLAP